MRRHVRILVDLGKLAGEAADLDRFLDHAVMQVARAVEIDHVKVLRYRWKTADLFMAAGLDWKEGVVRSATLSADLRSPAGRAYQTAEPVVIPNCDNAPGFVMPEMLKQHGIVALTNVPALIDDATRGVLEIDSTKPRNFSEDTIEFLTAAGALIGSVVSRHLSNEDEAARVVAAGALARSHEVLLRELQHRMKNSFQLILASISLQKRRIDNEEAARALDHVANRINAISLAHDQLTPRDNGQVVDLSSYLRALCASIEQQADGVAIDVYADTIGLTIDRAVPLGIILNEAATNSVKHAFGDKGGRITVTLKGGVGCGEARLTVGDNGQGIRNPRPGGSSLKLIASLVRQIGGKVDQESSDRGTTTTITFPIIN